MKQSPFSYGIADFADELHSILRQNARLKDEVEELREYRQKYIDLLNETSAHSSHMMGGLLALAMKPGVLEACGKSNAQGELHDATPSAG